MRKKLIIFGLALVFGIGLAFNAQAREIASFKEANLGQIELAVLREGPTGGWPVLVDDHLKVSQFLFVDKGIVSGKSGGDPVIIGDHMRIDGYLQIGNAIVRGVPGGDPVIIADHLRVDGEISRPFGPVKVKDDLEVTGKLSFPRNSITDAMVVNDITASNYLPLAGGTLTGNLTVNGVSGLTDSDIPDTITASNYLPLAGGTLTGNLTVNGVSGLTDSDIPDTITVSDYLPLTGGILTGDLTVGNVTATGTISEGGTALSDKYAPLGAEHYVDRGDTASADFTILDFTADGTFHDLDLSAIVPEAGANRLVHIKLDIAALEIPKFALLRTKGQTFDWNSVKLNTKIAHIPETISDCWVLLDANRKIQYSINSATWDFINLTVRGWYQDE